MKIMYVPQKSHWFSNGLNNQISSYCHHLIPCSYKKKKHIHSIIYIHNTNDVIRHLFTRANKQLIFMQYTIGQNARTVGELHF